MDKNSILFSKNFVVFFSLFVILASTAYAANGQGSVLSYSPKAVTVSTTQDIDVEFLNNGSACIDEIIFTAPATWSNSSPTTVTAWTRGGTSAITVTNEADDGTLSGLVSDDQSVRIVSAISNKLLCSGEKVNFTVSGLTAPGAPENSTFHIYTSDQFSNEPSVSAVRNRITPPWVVIRVTDAEGLKVEYVQLHTFGVGGAAEVKFLGTGKGGWGRVTELYVTRAGAGTTADVYLDNGDGVFDPDDGDGLFDPGEDFLLNNNFPLSGAGLRNTIPLTYTAFFDVFGTIESGFIKDSSTGTFWIDLAAGGTVVTPLDGHADEFMTPDPTSVGTGFEATTEGTVINVDTPAVKRLVKVQLVRVVTINGTPKLIDVRDSNVPIGFTTTLSTFTKVSPQGTDVNGEVELPLNPGTLKGIALVTVQQLGLSNGAPALDSDVVPVGINAGAPVRWEITDGVSSTSVPAGAVQLIEATVYDQYGNVITDLPSRPSFNFSILSSPPGAALDDDDVPGSPSNDEGPELTTQGISDANLLTSTTEGDHVVKVCADSALLPSQCQTTTIHGVAGAPAKIVIEAPGNMTAEDCIDATIKVTDANGNLIDVYKDPITGHDQEWSSLVRVELTDPIWTDRESPVTGNQSRTYISDSDFEEEEFFLVNGFNDAVQGKLTGGVGHVTVCGCQGLGIFDLHAFSDTLTPGEINVSVENAPPECISLEVEGKDNDLLSCEDTTKLDVGILDACGNYVVDRGCNGGKATTCVPLTVSDPTKAYLSTDVVCVDITDTGHSALVDLVRNTTSCGDVTIDVAGQQQCCDSKFPIDLEACDPLDMTLIGEPDKITSEFTRERDGVVVSNDGSDWVSEPIYDTFTAVDACGNVVEDFNGELDVQLKGEDCVSFIEVDSPADTNIEGVYCTGTPVCRDLSPQGQGKCQESGCTWTAIDCSQFAPKSPECSSTNGCAPAPDDSACLGNGGVCDGHATTNACEGYTFDQCWIYKNEDEGRGCEWEVRDEGKLCTLPGVPVFKLVIDNCGRTEKQWTDLEKNDIMVDKLAFTVGAPDYNNLWLFVYRESEDTPGFQSGEDELVAKIPANNTGSSPGGLSVGELRAADEYFGADWFTRGTEPIGTAGDEREGGALIRAGDTSDFYVVLKTSWSGGSDPVECGVYDVNFAFYQDYTNADIIDREFSGEGEDYDLDNDDHNYITDGDDSRNNNYANSQGYGFGDKFLNNLDFLDGVAWILFRDLTAEDVDVISSDVQMNGDVCEYQPDAAEGKCFVKDNCKSPLPIHVTKEDCQDVRGESWRDPYGVCHNLPQADASLIDVEPNPEEITFLSQLATQVVLINHDGFEPRNATCTDEGRSDHGNSFLLNLQTADGFQNPHAKELEVRLEWCLQWPIPVEPDENGELSDIPDFASEFFDFDDQDVDRCFNKEDLRKLISSEFQGYLDPVLFGQFFGEEFQDFIDSIFADDTVEFLDATTSVPLPTLIDDEGNPYWVVFTNSAGQAQVRVASRYTGLFKVVANPLALDQDYTFVNFKAGVPTQLDVIALPAFGVPADGEEEALLLLRALDECGNPVEEEIEDVTVSVDSDSGQAVISRDFDCENNYDDDVTGDFTSSLFGTYGCLLQVMDDIPETATVTATHASLVSNTTEIVFQGAPVKLNIVSIMPSDRIPADGVCEKEFPDGGDDDGCMEGRLGTGAWVDIEVQDKNSNRVTGYLGKGFAGDPLDPDGLTDFVFDSICVKFNDPNAYIPEKWWERFEFGNSTKFGWINFDHDGTIDCEGKPGESCNVYCGDLLFGKGSVYVAYENTDNNHGGSFEVTVFDREDFQCQEINENGLPASDLATQCQKDTGQLDFVDPATKWNAESSKIVIPADGVSKATLTVKIENDFMAVRQAVEGTAQSDLDGSVLSWLSADGTESDPLNPASIVFLTNWKTGLATLEIKSTTPGKARIIITGGDAYVCHDIDHPDMAESGDNEELDPGLLDPLTDEDYDDCIYSSKKDLQPKVIEVEFLEVADNQVSLLTGWNFVSTPHKLTTSGNELGEFTSGSACFSGTAFEWDASSQSFVAMSSSSPLNQLEGYWINMDCDEVLDYTYLAADATTPPQKGIEPGWNTAGLTLDNPLLVELGLISIDSVYTTVVDWLEGSQDYGLPVSNTGVQCDNSIPPFILPFTTCGSQMQPKQGYWVWSTGSSTLSGFDV